MNRSLYRRKIIRQRGAGWGRLAAKIGAAVGGELLKGTIKFMGNRALKQIGLGYSNGRNSNQEGGNGYRNGLASSQEGGSIGYANGRNSNQEGGNGYRNGLASSQEGGFIGYANGRNSNQGGNGYRNGLASSQEGGGSIGYANGRNSNQEGGQINWCIRKHRQKMFFQRGGRYWPRHSNGRFAKRTKLSQVGGFFDPGDRNAPQLPNNDPGRYNDPTKNNRHRKNANIKKHVRNRDRLYRKRDNVPAMRDLKRMNPRFGYKSLHRATSGWYLHGVKAGNERKGRNAELKRLFTLIAEKMHKNGTGYMKFLRRGTALDPDMEYKRLNSLLARYR